MVNYDFAFPVADFLPLSVPAATSKKWLTEAVSHLGLWFVPEGDIGYRHSENSGFLSFTDSHAAGCQQKQ
jgi:hypothetical protein